MCLTVTSLQSTFLLITIFNSKKFINHIDVIIIIYAMVNFFFSPLSLFSFCPLILCVILSYIFSPSPSLYFFSPSIYLCINQLIFCVCVYVFMYMMFMKNCVFSQFTATPPSPTKRPSKLLTQCKCTVTPLGW